MILINIVMDFKNATVNKKANVYFNGNVTSRNIILSDGSIKTLGLMLIGEYEFNTSKKEIMDITTGELEVLIANTSEWILIKDNNSFEIPANSSFKVKVHMITNYCCSYID
tara:strand:- start:611 stop:943 length:333 start_codon:yes stop_codon:yes gene_type:complete